MEYQFNQPGIASWQTDRNEYLHNWVTIEGEGYNLPSLFIGYLGLTPSSEVKVRVKAKDGVIIIERVEK